MKLPKGLNAIWIYGTLKDPSQIDNYTVKGRLFDIGPFPGIILGGEKEIPGQITIVTDEKLESLDVYEGVPNFYTRERTTARPLNDEDEAIDVWVYQWARPTEGFMEINRW